MSDPADVMWSLVEARADPDTLAWLRRGLFEPGGEFQRSRFFAAYAGAGRRLRRFDAAWSDAERQALQTLGYADPQRLSLGEATRALLLMRALSVLPDDQHVELVEDAVRRGDNAERCAALRCLATLPGPERFVALAIDACRSHVQGVFEAVACDNPYAADHFPQSAFNQLVMKAMFTEVPLQRVVGWQRRVDSELQRMARDFRAERQAAGRPVPEGVELIVAATPSEANP